MTKKFLIYSQKTLEKRPKPPYFFKTLLNIDRILSSDEVTEIEKKRMNGLRSGKKWWKQLNRSLPYPRPEQ